MPVLGESSMRVIPYERSHGAYLTVCVRALQYSALCLCPCCSNFFPVAVIVSVQHISQRTAFQDVAEMLLVVQREVEEDGSWLNSDNPKK
ncbi:hypothetical protein KUCAC02_014032 [Chaenocephalus aceratus]|uniref:Uncharacterized protein n=1 Tax=Chaenocephalus aceratus TaxID=36190 RepID=A0ACB9WDG8_CHAAC|nr:hypothetical protein KUCAC02_014032 [Chaenocephalus aceratus]